MYKQYFFFIYIKITVAHTHCVSSYLLNNMVLHGLSIEWPGGGVNYPLYRLPVLSRAPCVPNTQPVGEPLRNSRGPAAAFCFQVILPQDKEEVQLLLVRLYQGICVVGPGEIGSET